MSTLLFPSLQVTYCDDVRQESNGKLFRIGIYMSEMTVPAFPVTLPKLHLSALYAHPLAQPEFAPLKFSVSRGDEVLTEMDFPQLPSRAQADPEARWAVQFLEVDLQPYDVNQAHRLRVRVETEAGTIEAPPLLVRAMTPEELQRFGPKLPPQ